MVVILWPFIDRQFHGDHHTEHNWIFVKKTMNRAFLKYRVHRNMKVAKKKKEMKEEEPKS